MKYLTFKEYNAILIAINSSTDYVVYGKDRKKDFYETLFNKLFNVTQEDMLNKVYQEEINKPISKS